jgi:long-chain acyl-CoA synthetase
MEEGGAKFFVGVDKGVVDRVLSVADSLPNLKKIIVIDPQGMLPFADPRLISFQEVKEMGRKRREKEPGLFKQKVSEVQEEDIASIMWTTGTTGPPKGAMSSHRSALATLNWPDVFPEYAGPNERVLNYLPPEHGFGRTFDIWMPIETGAVVYIGEGPAKMMEAFREVQPTLLVAAPRTLEKYATEALAEIEKSGRLKQIAYRAAAWVGRRVLRRRWEGKPLMHWWLLNLLGQKLLFNPILKKVGFLKTKYIAVGGTMVPPRVMTLWQMWGLEARELYAGAESGYVTFQVGPWPKPGSAGKKVPWVELKVTSEGELLTQGPGQFSGYWADEEATKKAKGSGWVNTGDIVEVLEGGEYKIIDRIKEIIITSGGENLSPLVIEDALKTSPYISEAAAFGDAHKYPVALIGIDFNKVSDWAQSRGIPHTSYASLAQDPQVFKLIEEEVKKGNAQLARVQQVKQFRITPQELHPGEGGWYKISRRRLYEQYHDLIESMYVDEKSRIGMEVGELAKDLKEIGEIA